MRPPEQRRVVTLVQPRIDVKRLLGLPSAKRLYLGSRRASRDQSAGEVDACAVPGVSRRGSLVDADDCQRIGEDLVELLAGEGSLAGRAEERA